MSGLTLQEHTRGVDITAYGGTRRERAGRISAYVRGRGLKLTAISYSETYGFQSATYASYVRKDDA